MKKWFKYFVYLSLIFLIVALIRNDYFHLPQFISWNFLFLSLAFLFAGFLLDALAWFVALKVYGYSSVKVAHAISGMGLSVFGKYIPGKVWIILGRSAYVAKRNKIKESEAAAISLNAQFIALWVGLILGMASFLMYSERTVMLAAAISILVGLSFLLFSGLGHRLFSLGVKKIFKRDLVISRLSSSQVLQVLPYYVLNWLTWCAGFYFMIHALSPVNYSPLLGLNFALAATLGIAAIIAPGGLGVREGILATLLHLSGINLTEATSIAVVSRLWFLFGEGMFFIVAIVCRIFEKR